MLQVNPGQFDNLLNNNLPYDTVKQNIDLRTYYTNNSVSLTKAIKYFTLESKLGLQLENQKLSSDIATSANSDLSPDFSNTLDWFRSKIYADVQTQFKKANWRIELSTPINLHSYSIKDAPLQKSENLSQTTFEPRLTVNYEINSYWKVNSSASVNNQFGVINQLHYGYILQNYRTIKRVDSPLPQSVNHNYGAGLSFRDPVKSLFFTVNYDNLKSENNILYQTNVLPNGSVTVEAISKTNSRNSHNFSTRIGKYFYDIKSNITLNGSFVIKDFQQIVNSQLTDIKNQNIVFGTKIDTDISDWFNIEYASTWTFSRNEVQKQTQPKITQQNHVVNFNFHLQNKQYLGFKSEYVTTGFMQQSNQNVFADCIYRYTIAKKKIDIEAQLTNIFGTNNYKSISNNDFSFITTNFNLRPRQLLFKVRFSL